MIRQALILFTLLILFGCGQETDKTATKQLFTTSNGPVGFHFPKGWRENQSENPYDLQCFSKHEKMNTGVFLFTRDDIAETVKPRDILMLQIDDLKSKRNNFKIKEDEKTVQVSGKRLTSLVYSGEKGLSRFYYRFTLVEFNQNPEFFAVVLQVAFPSYWSKHKPILEQITNSAQVLTPGKWKRNTSMVRLDWFQTPS